MEEITMTQLLSQFWEWLVAFILTTGAVVFAMQRIIAGKNAIKENIKKEFELTEWRKAVDEDRTLIKNQQEKNSDRILNLEQTPDLQHMILEQIKEMDRKNSEDHQANKDSIDRLGKRIDDMIQSLLKD